MSPHVSSVSMRRAGAADLPAILRIIEAAYSPYVPVIGRRPVPMDDDQAARLDRGELFVAEEAGALLGVVTMGPRDGKLHVYNLAIDPAAQGRGLARVMIDYAEAHGRTLGFPTLTLFTNVEMPRNRALYAHLGFEERYVKMSERGYEIVFFERPIR